MALDSGTNLGKLSVQAYTVHKSLLIGYSLFHPFMYVYVQEFRI